MGRTDRDKDNRTGLRLSSSTTRLLRLEVTVSQQRAATMSDKKESDIDTTKPYGEPEVMATAVPAGGNEPPIPSGHARFYCNKCHTVRDTTLLPCRCRVAGRAKRYGKMRIISVRLCSTHSRCRFSTFFSLAAVRPSRQGDFVALRELHGVQLHYTR
jgi:hypothetical protein